MLSPRPQHPIRRAEFARRSGRARSTITEACAGELAPALAHGGRYIDAAHPVAREWAIARGVDPDALVGLQRRGYRVSTPYFAELLGLDAPPAELANHVVDVAEPWVLELAAARPFPRDENGEVPMEAVVEGFLAPARVGPTNDDPEQDVFDMRHPMARLWLTRLHGRVPDDHPSFSAARQSFQDALHLAPPKSAAPRVIVEGAVFVVGEDGVGSLQVLNGASPECDVDTHRSANIQRASRQEES